MNLMNKWNLHCILFIFLNLPAIVKNKGLKTQFQMVLYLLCGVFDPQQYPINLTLVIYGPYGLHVKVTCKYMK